MILEWNEMNDIEDKSVKINYYITGLTPLYIVTLVIGFCVNVSNGANCSSTKTYPYLASSESGSVTYTPSPAQSALNGITGFFSVGELGDITGSSFGATYEICCNDEEKEWSLSYESYSASASVTPSIGADALGIINSIIGAVNGAGFSTEQLGSVSNGISELSISGVSASFSYEAGFYASYDKQDECACTDTTAIPFFGTEEYELTAAGPSYDSPILYFDLMNGSCSSLKSGIVVGETWSVSSTSSGQIISRWRFGEHGQEESEIHVSYNGSTVPLSSGAACDTSLTDY